MIQLIENRGIPRHILWMMATVGGLTVANLYYNQPLLEDMRASLGIGEAAANLITVVTQLGYALGLVFIVPMADIYSRRRIVTTSMAAGMAMAMVIAVAANVATVWAASVVLGACSVVPQIFVPMAGLSLPTNRPTWASFFLVFSRVLSAPASSAATLAAGWGGDGCLEWHRW